MKAIEQYFHVVLFIMLYKVVLSLLSFKSVDKTLVCDHSNCAVISGGVVSCHVFRLRRYTRRVLNSHLAV